MKILLQHLLIKPFLDNNKNKPKKNEHKKRNVIFTIAELKLFNEPELA